MKIVKIIGEKTNNPKPGLKSKPNIWDKNGKL